MLLLLLFPPPLEKPGKQQTITPMNSLTTVSDNSKAIDQRFKLLLTKVKKCRPQGVGRSQN
jgi:hypothetical protein